MPKHACIPAKFKSFMDREPLADFETTTAEMSLI